MTKSKMAKTLTMTKALAMNRTLPTHMTEKSFIKEFCTQSRSKSSIVKEINLNISCLKTFYGHKQKDLLAYSSAGNYGSQICLTTRDASTCQV